MALFFKILGIVFLAEMGDKSQLLTVALVSRYRPGQIICGASLAVLALNALAIAVGSLLGGMLPMTAIDFCAGFAFCCFAVASLGEEDEDDGEGPKKESRHGAVLTIFGTFFLAELGDKTQLTALAFAADSRGEGSHLGVLLTIFVGASLGLILADMMGLFAGLLLGKKLPAGAFSVISAVIFALCGIIRLLSSFEAVFAPYPMGRMWTIVATSVIGVVFLTLGFKKLVGHRKAVKS